jgi:uncharacterized protein YxeA
MKKVLFILASVAFAINANAKFKFVDLSIEKDNTTIVIEDDKWKSGSEVCCAKFNNDGKTYDATSMVTEQDGDKMSITMTYDKMNLFNHTSVTLTVNGKEVKVPIDLGEIVSSSL